MVMPTTWQPHELIWLEAAMDLVGSERVFAFRDISDLTKRSVYELEAKSKAVYATRRAGKYLLAHARTELNRAQAPSRTVMVPAAGSHHPIRQPTKAQMMAGR